MNSGVSLLAKTLIALRLSLHLTPLYYRILILLVVIAVMVVSAVSKSSALLIFLLVSITFLLPLQVGAEPYTRDFEAAAHKATEKARPHLMLFSANECGFCERLDQEVLSHLDELPVNQPLQISEINIDQGGKVIDFDGDPIRQRLFVGRYEVFATPTLILVDAQGTPISKPIVGYRNKAQFVDSLQQAARSD